MNYKYTINDNQKVGLHDCRANQMIVQDRTVSFCFPEGFYYLDESMWKDDDYVRTGAAQMDCHLAYSESDMSVYVYRKNLFGKVIREDWTEKLAEKINFGKYELEFVTVYRAYNRLLLQGYLWFDRAPYHMECEIEMDTDSQTFFWNDKEEV